MAAFAFESAAPNVLIRNVIVEKYASVAQKGAIQSKGAAGWIVENCEVRLNSGTGIVIQAGGRVRGCDVHHNGQMGIGGRGKDILHGTGTPEPGAEGPTGLLHCCINQLASIPTIVKREALKGDVISSACGDRAE